MPRSCSLNLHIALPGAKAVLLAVADYSVVLAIVAPKGGRLAELAFIGAKAGGSIT